MSPDPWLSRRSLPWDREELGGVGEESREEYDLRDDAAERALIGLAVSSRGVWDGEEIVVKGSGRSKREIRAVVHDEALTPATVPMMEQIQAQIARLQHILPAVQAEFGVARSAASLPYTATMICFGLGGIVMGRLSDRVGIFVPVAGGAVTLALGYLAASHATSLWQFILAQGLLVGVASSVSFAPVIADTSLWFTRNRGIAVAIIACGSYLAGTVWPPVVQHFIERDGWRRTYLGIAVFCVATMYAARLSLRMLTPSSNFATKSLPPSR